eukprot:6187725-Pleurochrysis_carterae.AAC.1
MGRWEISRRVRLHSQRRKEYRYSGLKRMERARGGGGSEASSEDESRDSGEGVECAGTAADAWAFCFQAPRPTSLNCSARALPKRLVVLAQAAVLEGQINKRVLNPFFKESFKELRAAAEAGRTGAGVRKGGAKG